MYTKVKKILLFAILIIIVLSILIGFLASPKTYAATTEDGLFEYSVQDNYVKITKYLGNQSVVSIPNSIDEYPVTQISAWAFNKCSSITKVVIPDNITNINYTAFTECTSLTQFSVGSSNVEYSVDSNGILYNKDKTTLICYPIGKTNTSLSIPNTVTNIGSYAFYKSSYLSEVSIPNTVKEIGDLSFQGCNNIREIIIPNSVESLGSNAFQRCTNLTKITLSENIKEIPYMMFQGCSKLSNITIPDSVTSIRFSAFSDCSSLTSINISKYVTFIDSSTFSGCTELKSIIVDKENTKYTNYNDDILYTKDSKNNYILCYPAGKTESTFSIPEGVSYIDSYAFHSCESLISVEIPYTVTGIGGESFMNCSNLTTIIIPGSVISIGDYTFRNCNKLTSITIPDNVERIGSAPFEGCSNLVITTKSNSKAHQHAINKGINVKLDDIQPSLQAPVYSITKPTKDNVVVIITANEAIQKIILDENDWSYVANTNNKSITATFTENITNKQLNIKDLVGNEATIIININNIDRTLPTVTVTTDKDSYKAGETAIITATFNEAIQDETPKISMSGMSTLAETKMTKSSDKIYTYNYVIPNKSGTQTISISGASDIAGNIMNINSTKTFNVTPTINSIAITAKPNKTTYIEGQNFDANGMKVTATYNDETSKEVTNYTITDGNNLTVGKTTITVSYTENGVTKTTTQAITVIPKALSSIRVSTTPSKTTYIEGQNFDATGMKVTATYNNGTTKEITNYTVTDGNNLTADKTRVTISYTENSATKTTTQAITVVKKALTSIEITTVPAKTTYIEGQNFDATGMKVTATYNDETSKEVTNYTITDGNNLTTDKTSVTISYTESGVTKTTIQSITVIKKLEISFDEYNEVNKDGNKYIDNIAPSTTMENLINNVETNGTITVYKDNKEITNKKIKISTGMKVKISLNNENYEFTIVVKGDTNGDGESDLRDLLQINKHRLNKTLLTAEYLLAGDVNKDNEVNLKDLLQINKFRLGKVNTL